MERIRNLLLLFANNNQPTIQYTFNGTIPQSLTFSRGSNATYYNSSGTLVSAANNVPRFDYNPSTLAINGLLMEAQATNLIYPSIPDNGTVWTYAGVNPANNVLTAPDGTLTATSITDAGSSNHSAVITVSATSGTVYTHSIYAKAGTAYILQLSSSSSINSSTSYVNANLTTGQITQTGGTLVGYGIANAGNGWYRIWMTWTSTATASGSLIVYMVNNNPTAARGGVYTATGETAYIWGEQLEALQFPSSYIPTTTTTATRSADNLVNSNVSPWFNPNAGTFVCNYLLVGIITTASQGVVALSDGTNNNQLAHYLLVSVTSDAQILIGGTAAASGLSSTLAPNTPYSFGMSYQSGSNAAAVNGSLLGGSGFGSSALPSGINNLRFGNNGGVSRPFYGWIQNFKYWNYKFSTAQLQKAT